MEENKKKSNLKNYLITALVSFGIGVVVFSIDFFTKKLILLNACNACALAGIVLICVAGLIYVSREGFFDFASYGFKQLGSMIFSKNPNEHNDFVKYKEEKNLLRENKSRNYLIVALVGVLFVTAFLVLRIILLKDVPLN